MRHRCRIAAFLAVMLCTGLFPGNCASALEPAHEVSDLFRSSAFYERLCAVELTGDYHTDLANVALSQLGYHEGDTWDDYGGGNVLGANNFIEYGSVYYGLNGQWCAIFVSWCARQAEIPRYVLNSAARAASDGQKGTTDYYFHLATVSKRTYNPRPGDIVFFSSTGYGSDHVGIVVKTTETGFYTVEGNSTNAVRLKYYDYEDEYIRYYGLYDQWRESSGSVSDFAAAELEFVATIGERGCLPEDADERYTFTKMWAVSGTKTAIPEKAFAMENSTLKGFHIRRPVDGCWLAEDGAWYPTEEFVYGDSALFLLPDGSTLTGGEGFLSRTDRLQLYCVWDESGREVTDPEEAALFTPDETGWLNPFTDVSAEDWYYSSYRSGVSLGFLSAAPEIFPQSGISRDDYTRMLYRLNGSPADLPTHPFTDVAESGAQAQAVSWAYAAGIVSGTAEGHFSPEAGLTREQAIVMLYRMLGGESSGEALPFADAASISPWAAEAAAWAYESGLLRGEADADGELNCAPRSQLTHAQAVTLVCRAWEFKNSALQVE